MAAYNIIYSGAADTYVIAPTSATYSTVRDSTASSAGQVTGAAGGVQHAFSGGVYRIWQAFLVFDTSSVPTGAGTGNFSINVSVLNGNVDADTIRIHEVSTTTNKIPGASLSALTLHANPGTFPTGPGRYTAAISNVAAIPRSSAFSVVLHTAGEESGTAPTGLNRVDFDLSEQTGTTNDPFLFLAVGGWGFVGVSNEVAVATTAHALVTTGISGTLAAGDLLVACITSRIASTTSITLPTGGEWTLVSEQKNNNTLTTSSALPSGLMAYCVRGAANPNLTFTHPVAPSQAQGRIVAYRNVNTTSPKDTQTSFTTATAVTAVSGTGLTTTQIEDLIVAMACGGQEAAWSSFNATDPAGASGATVTTAPTTTWSERADSAVTTGADGSLAIFDAVKLTSGATGNLTATASVSAGHVVIAGAFKIAVASATGTGTPTGQGGAASGAGVSGSAGAGTPAAQASAVSGLGTVASAAVSGIGALAADVSVVSGAGVSASVVTGALVAQSATTAGAGASASSGTGALVAQDAAASGIGLGTSTGTGALAAASATASGTGVSVSVGTGALQVAAAAIVGAGISASTGTGSLVAGSAEVAGTGTAAAANSGVLVAQAAALAGLGVSASTGIGALQAGVAAIAGAGLVASAGTGDLVAGPATVTGEGTVIAAGATVGTGALVAGAATLSGEGEAIGEVAPPVSVGGGYWRPYRRPVAVEGVGYAILPHLEGEAHGVVLVAGAGAALPRISGVGTGAVGVAGRSAATLATVKATGIGDRGQAGAARAVLKGLSVAGAGAGGANCTDARAIMALRGAAIGRHDDDEAAIMALLLAA